MQPMPFGRSLTCVVKGLCEPLQDAEQHQNAVRRTCSEGNADEWVETVVGESQPPEPVQRNTPKAFP